MPTVNALAGNPDAELGDLLEVQDVRRRAQQAGKAHRCVTSMLTLPRLEVVKHRLGLQKR